MSTHQPARLSRRVFLARVTASGAALGALLALAPLGCTSAEDEFCGRLGDTYQLDELVTSISSLDKPAITRHLTELRELQHEAPAEVHDDLRAVIDALVDEGTFFPYKDLFALQDQITAQVAAALKLRLQSPPANGQSSGPARPVQGDRPPSNNLEAYSAYMQARAPGTTQEEATRQYDRAIRLDPAYGLAYSAKARMLIDAVSNGLSGAEAADAYAQADAAIEQAMRVAPEQASTRIARGKLLMLRDFDWQGGEAELKRAVELAPDDGEALFQLGVARASQGDLAQAVELTRKALKLDPRNLSWYPWLVAYLMPLGRLDEAEQAIAQAIELHDGIYNHYLLTISKVLRKDAAGAKKAAEAEPAGEWHDFALALAMQIGPDRKQADALLQACIDQYASGWAFQIAQLYAVRGEPDRMFDWLQRAWKARDPGMQTLLYDALLLRYRNDPRYAALAKDVGLPSPAAPATP